MKLSELIPGRTYADYDGNRFYFIGLDRARKYAVCETGINDIEEDLQYIDEDEVKNFILQKELRKGWIAIDVKDGSVCGPIFPTEKDCRSYMIGQPVAIYTAIYIEEREAPDARS